jgi:hypothetical protein
VRGLLVDENVQGHLPHLRRFLDRLDLWSILVAVEIEFAAFPQLGLQPGMADRTLWEFCQREGWVLLTDNRNNDGHDSLEATLRDSWQTGNLPVLTIADKAKFERDRTYAEHAATQIAEVLFGIQGGKYRDLQRIFIPR